MVNTFVKAGILTLFILGAWFIFSTGFEAQQNVQILGKIDTVIAQENAVQTYLDYLEDTQDTERFCTVLEKHIQTQNETLFSLLQDLEVARKSSLNNQYDAVRKRFQAANSLLYFSLKRFEKKCPDVNALQEPILYFFSDNQDCPACELQARVLDEVGATCTKPIQIFAFPVEGGIESIDLLVTDYNISQTPSLVIDEVVYAGVQKASFLKQKLGCA